MNRIRYKTEVNPSLIYFWSKRPNFGDYLAPFVVEQLSGRRPVNVRGLDIIGSETVYGIIGSILHHDTPVPLELWGPGFVRPTDSFRVRPRKIHAIRGPLSRQRCLEQGIDCPPIYGDPAFLVPHWVEPQRSRSFRVGIVPHYRDMPILKMLDLSSRSEIKIIDPGRRPVSVINDIACCDTILSSSLHGLVIAIAYGIPCKWIAFEKIDGGGFKYKDMFSSLGVTDISPHYIEEYRDMSKAVSNADSYEVTINLEELVASCPIHC